MMCVLYYFNILVSILLFASTRSSVLRDDFQSKTMSTRSEGPEESYSNDMYLATNTDDESLKKLSQPVYEERVKPLIDKMKSFKRRLDNFVEEIRSKHKKRRRDHDRWSYGRTSTRHHYNYDHDRSYENSKSDKDDDWRSSKYKDRSERYYDEKDRDFSYDRSYDYQEPYLYQERDNYAEHDRQNYHDYEPESKSESRKERYYNSHEHDDKDDKHDDKEQYSSDYSDDSNNAESDDYRYGDTANYEDADDNYDDDNYNSADYGSDSREETKKGDREESARKSQVEYDDDGYDKSYTGGTSKEQREEDDEGQYEGDDRYERYNKYDYKKDRTVSSFSDDFDSSNRLKEDYNPYGYQESSSVDQRSDSVPEVKTEFVNPANIIPL